MNWTERILDFPVRAAAVDDFLRDLRAKGTGDLNAVLTTLNEGGLCRQAVDYWLGNGWIVLAPDSPITALAGPDFDRTLSLRYFCGDVAGAMDEEESGGIPQGEEETQDDGDS
jgi:hypothetical protein